MKTFRLVLMVALATAVVALMCSSKENPKGGEKKKEGTKMSLKLTSPAFRDGERIPQKYTCEGKDVSPPLEWSGAPEGTKSFALICDDPDAPMGTWVHWVVYNIPNTTNSLLEAVPKGDVVLGGVSQGMTSFGWVGYGGPCPPRGPAHRYFFKLYALDTLLNLEPGVTKEKLLKAMEGHILATAQLMGLYSR